MIRPVERFPVEIVRHPARPAAPERGGRGGVGPVGLAATACLGAALTILAQHAAAGERLSALLASLLARLAG